MLSKLLSFYSCPTCQINVLACGILATTAGILFWNFQSAPAQANLIPRIVEIKPTQEPGKDKKPELLSGQPAVESFSKMLQAGRDRLLSIPHYQVTFFKRERIDGGNLQDGQSITLKLRHQPFGVYMKWLTGVTGQEVLYVDGELDNRMIVKKGGRMGAILPAIKLEPTSSLAMSESRHPITEAGLLHLAELTLEYRQRDLGRIGQIQCTQVPDALIEGRRCTGFITEYQSAEIEPLYRKSIVYIDREWSIPVCIKNYTWPDENDCGEKPEGETDPEWNTLIEHYAFSDIKFDAPLDEEDFSQANAEYKFIRR